MGENNTPTTLKGCGVIRIQADGPVFIKLADSNVLSQFLHLSLNFQIIFVVKYLVIHKIVETTISFRIFGFKFKTGTWTLLSQIFSQILKNYFVLTKVNIFYLLRLKQR